MTVLLIGYGLAAFCAAVFAWACCKVAADADARNDALHHGPNWNGCYDPDELVGKILTVEDLERLYAGQSEPVSRGEGFGGLTHDHLNISGR